MEEVIDIVECVCSVLSIIISLYSLKTVSDVKKNMTNQIKADRISEIKISNN